MISERQTNDHKEIIKRCYLLRAHNGAIIITDVFKGKLPFCDVARGQIGKPLSFIKGNLSFYRSLVIQKICPNAYPMHKPWIILYFV